MAYAFHFPLINSKFLLPPSLTQFLLLIPVCADILSYLVISVFIGPEVYRLKNVKYREVHCSCTNNTTVFSWP